MYKGKRTNKLYGLEKIKIQKKIDRNKSTKKYKHYKRAIGDPSTEQPQFLKNLFAEATESIELTDKRGNHTETGDRDRFEGSGNVGAVELSQSESYGTDLRNSRRKTATNSQKRSGAGEESLSDSSSGSDSNSNFSTKFKPNSKPNMGRNVGRRSSDRDPIKPREGPQEGHRNDERVTRHKPNPFQRHLEAKKRMMAEADEERERRTQEIEARKKHKVEVRKKRKINTHLMTKKTKKGQPVISSQISLLLGKLEAAQTKGKK